MSVNPCPTFILIAAIDGALGVEIGKDCTIIVLSFVIGRIVISEKISTRRRHFHRVKLFTVYHILIGESAWLGIVEQSLSHVLSYKFYVKSVACTSWRIGE